MWVKFLGNFSFKPTQGSTIDYRAGSVLNVTTPCAEKAIAAGKAEALPDTGPKSRKAMPKVKESD